MSSRASSPRLGFRLKSHLYSKKRDSPPMLLLLPWKDLPTVRCQIVRNRVRDFAQHPETQQVGIRVGDKCSGLSFALVGSCNVRSETDPVGLLYSPGTVLLCSPLLFYVRQISSTHLSRLTNTQSNFTSSTMVLALTTEPANLPPIVAAGNRAFPSLNFQQLKLDCSEPDFFPLPKISPLVWNLLVLFSLAENWSRKLNNACRYFRRY